MIPEIEKLPRVKLGFFPTPLAEAQRLSSVLGGPRILIKREDLTGLALGGNKCRKLEFMMADIEEKGYDAVISTAGSQSNWCLQVAAAARKLGMEAAFVHFSGVHPEVQGNLLLHNILGVQNKILEGRIKWEGPRMVLTGNYATEKDRVMGQLVEKFREKGRKAIILNAGVDINDPYNLQGASAYVDAVEELEKQLEAQNVGANYLVFAQGLGTTHAGLILGVKVLKLSIKPVGIAVSRPTAEGIDNVVINANATAKFLGLDVSITPDEVTVYDDYFGAGYGEMTEQCLEAIKLVAQTEGIFLDPVYTGKAMAGLIDLIKKGRFKSTDTIVFIHTGGIPALFAYNKEIAS